MEILLANRRARALQLSANRRARNRWRSYVASARLESVSYHHRESRAVFPSVGSVLAFAGHPALTTEPPITRTLFITPATLPTTVQLPQTDSRATRSCYQRSAMHRQRGDGPNDDSPMIQPLRGPLRFAPSPCRMPYRQS